MLIDGTFFLRNNIGATERRLSMGVDSRCQALAERLSN
jgi:hypothetical protein